MDNEKKAPKTIAEMSDAERFPLLVARFEATLLDALRTKAKANDGVWTPSASALKEAAVPAFEEAMTADFDADGAEVHHSPRLLANVWVAVMKINESAYRQSLERMEKAKTLGFSLESKTRTTAKGYV